MTSNIRHMADAVADDVQRANMLALELEQALCRRDLDDCAHALLRVVSSPGFWDSSVLHGLLPRLGPVVGYIDDMAQWIREFYIQGLEHELGLDDPSGAS